MDMHMNRREFFKIAGSGALSAGEISSGGGTGFGALSLSARAQGATPPAYAQGWKDMVHVEGGWSEVLVKFDYEAPENAPYMYHCHILEYEDCGMMGQFTVG